MTPRMPYGPQPEGGGVAGWLLVFALVTAYAAWSAFLRCAAAGF